VGENSPCFIIGEVGLAHDGSLGAAHAYLDAIADAGADAVKFQTHIADAEGTKEEAFRVKIFPQDETRADYWRRTAFTEAEWGALKTHADEREIAFLSSPFSDEAVELLIRLGVAAWKIGSGETGNIPLLKRVAVTGLPVLLSTGMSPYAEIDEAVQCVAETGAPLILYQCASYYPTPPDKIGLNMLAEYRNRYHLPVGLSDHSGQACVGIAAHTLGACSLETHVTFSRASFGPDVPASLTLDEFTEMIDSIRFLEEARANPVRKDEVAEGLVPMRELFTKSVVAATAIADGSLLTAEMPTLKKPGTGIPARQLESLIGKKTNRAFHPDEQLTMECINDET